MSSESTISTRGLEFLAWLEVNKNRLVIGTAILAIVIAAFVIHRWRVSEREQVASAAPHPPANCRSIRPRRSQGLGR
jgi:predicted transcriptional regulator